MTALESWCLAMIGLVFQSLLAYVFVLLSLFREKSCQVKMVHNQTLCSYSRSALRRKNMWKQSEI